MPTTTIWLVCHAANAALRAGTFPCAPGISADDAEVLDGRAIEAIQAWRERWLPRIVAVDRQMPHALTSPAAIARLSARAAGFEAASVDALADANYGAWQGQRLTELARAAPEALAAWTREPGFRPPGGGESFDDVRERAGAWLDALPDAHETVVAFTHASVIRAAILHALGAPSVSFRQLEIAPLSVTPLRRSAHSWKWVAALS